jgi:putative redox protein
MSTYSALATFADPVDGMTVRATTGSGFEIAYDTDASEERGGPSPNETLLAALAACASMDVASILRKKRQVPTAYEIAVTGERAAEHPRVYTSIVVEHRVTGDIDAEAVRRSIELSATRYCPVNAALSKGVRVEHRYRLVRDARDDDPVSALVVVTGPS